MLYFEIVMTERSFRKAADRLQVAPSEVSRQIQRLESETGLHLFDRHPSGVVPTEQAECLLRYHRGCEATYEVLQSELDALRSLKTGRVSISASEGVIPALADEILWAFGNEYPDVRISVNIRATGEIVSDVLKDVAHIGIAYSPPTTEGIRVHRSAVHQVVAAVRPDHPLASQPGAIPFGRAISYPFATMPSMYGLGGTIDMLARSEAIRYQPAFVGNTLDVLRRFAIAGMGVAFLTDYSIAGDVAEGRLVGKAIDHPLLGRQSVQVLVKSDRTLPFAAHELLRRIETRMSTFAARDE
ncbi:transcriptional regulator [Burkholderia stagnalis]|nr:transcriptional regulator [Burkholderia stagnalis]KVO55560.1 transcriptional regulator [Burkholderia stagnalis]KVP13417.1 transcriptional regulator [Burkholderia stagnalis]KVW90665.1 transcriptional regulator [Burkholderia stagnalis]KVX55397.1 transcriptional regulator [Burkholderia stagnalis]